MQNIFVYGTLLSTEIITKLTGKTFKTIPAILSGFKKYCVKDCDYPAIIQMDDSSISGKVLENVDDESLKVISFYEGDEYVKQKVTVLINNGYKEVIAFIWVKGTECLENREWDLHYFQKNKLKYYVDVVIPETLEAIKNG